MLNRSLTIKTNRVLDATPLARIVQEAGNFESSIYILVDGKKINAKSIMGMMTLALVDGVEINIIADGTDEEVAITSLLECIANLCA